jgi:hypothetical protein
MKKLLFLVALAIGIASMKNHVSLTPDNQFHVMDWAFPVPAVIQSSPLYTTATTVMSGQIGALPTTAAAANPQYRTVAQPGRPPLPSVTSTAGTYNANAPLAGSSGGSDTFGSASKALRGTQ